MIKKNSFWDSLDNILYTHSIVIDRPKNSVHPRYSDYIYPFDYGYFKGTKSSDGDEIDCWIGSLDDKEISGIIVVLDPIKSDTEIKILVSCTNGDMNRILKCHHRGEMTGILIKKYE